MLLQGAWRPANKITATDDRADSALIVYSGVVCVDSTHTTNSLSSNPPDSSEPSFLIIQVSARRYVTSPVSQLHHATFGGITYYETKARTKVTFLSSKDPRAWLCAHLRDASVVLTARYREKCGKALIFYQTEPTRETEALTRLKTQTQREVSHLLLRNRNGQSARQKSCTMWENSRSKTQLTGADGNKSAVSQVSQREAGDSLCADKRAGLKRSRSSLALLIERGEVFNSRPPQKAPSAAWPGQTCDA